MTSNPVILLKAINYNGSGNWLDESNNSFDATLENGSIAKNTNGNGIILNGSTSWTFPNIGLGNNWTANVWYKQTSNTTDSLACIISQSFSDKINLAIGGNYTYSNSTFAGGFFDGNWRNGQPFTITNGQWINIQVSWDGIYMKTYINGILFGTTEPGGTVINSSGVYYIGRGWTPEYYLVGEIGEIRIYDYAINQAKVTADYQSSLPTFIWDPTTISGIQLWLDANDQSSITLSETTVTQWEDKSGQGNDVSQSTVGSQPTLSISNGMNFINTASDTYLTNGTMVFPETPYSIFAVGVNNTNAGSINTLITLNTDLHLFFGSVNGNFTTFTGSGNWNDTSPNTPLTTVLSLALMEMLNGGTSSTLIPYINGIALDPKNGTSTSVTGITIGHFTPGIATWAWNGYIGEILIYNSVLTQSQRQVVEGYLAWKWGIQTSLSLTHPFYSIAPSIDQSLIGLQILLRASNYSGSGIWRDESGYNRDATKLAGNILKNTAGNGIVLDGTTSWTFPNVRVGNAWTASVWYKNTGAQVGPEACILTQQIGTDKINIQIGSGNQASSDICTTFYTGTGWSGNEVKLSSLIGTNNWVNIQATWDGSNLKTYINSILYTSIAVNKTCEDSGNPYYIGGSWDPNIGFMTGEIGEIRIYNYAISQTLVTSDYQSSVSTFNAEPIILLKAINYSGSGAWLDESGNNKNATKTIGTIAKNSVGNGIILDGSTRWTFSNLSLGNSWSVNLWYKQTGVANNGLYGLLGQDYDGSSMNMNILNDYSNVGFYNGGWYYGSSITLINKVWTNIQVTWNGTNMITYINGVLLGSVATGGTSVDNSFPYYIGISWQYSVSIGEIGEVRIYNYSISPAQVNIDYTESLPTFIWEPTLIPGLQLWLDASDPLGVGLTLPVGNLTTWVDKSGENYNGIPVGSPSYASNSVTITPGNYINSYIPPGTFGSFNAFIVYQCITNSGTVSNSVITRCSTEFNQNLSNPLDLQNTGIYVGANNLNIFNSSYDMYNTSMSVFNINLNASTTVTQYVNGNQTASNSWTPSDLGNVVTIGSRADGFTSINANFYEVIVYNTTITTSQRKIIEGYLAWKWGIQSSLPAEHPFYSLQPTINQLLEPILVLKAIDYSGSGTWYDQTKNGYDATKENGTIAKNNQGNGIVLNGSTNWTFPNVNVGNAWTASVWYKNTATYLNNAECILTQNYNGNNNVNLSIGSILEDNTIRSGFYSNPWYTSGDLGLWSILNTWINIQVSWDGTNLLSYINGTLEDTVQLGGVSPDSGLDYRIGRRWDNDNYVTGEIGEVRMYNYAISSGRVISDYNESLSTFLESNITIPLIFIRPAVYSNSVELYWKKPETGNVSHYIITCLEETVEPITVYYPNTFLKITGLTTLEPYTFQIVAVGSSNTSPTATYRTVRPNNKPLAPTSATATSITNDGYTTITWTSIENLLGYAIIIQPLPSGEPIRNSALPDATSITVGGLNIEVSYTCSVYSVNDAGWSHPPAITDTISAT